jgi:nucleotide-binding universal stress UspA family protein
VIPYNPHQAYAETFVSKEDLENIQKNIEEDLADNYKERYIKKIEGEIEFETVTRSGREDNEILQFAKKENVDLIVMGTHGGNTRWNRNRTCIFRKCRRKSPPTQPNTCLYNPLQEKA